MSSHIQQEDPRPDTQRSLGTLSRDNIQAPIVQKSTNNNKLLEFSDSKFQETKKLALANEKTSQSDNQMKKLYAEVNEMKAFMHSLK